MNVTICIPTYNQEDYIEATVRSAAEQVPAPAAIIVSNDCSTDGTAAILDRLAEEIDLLRVIHQPRNLGMGANPDACMRMATTPYVVKLDSDDLLLPGYLAKLSAALDANPRAGYAHGQIQEIDGDGNRRRLRVLQRGTGMVSADEALRAALQGYRVAANIVMFRREALAAAGYVNTTMPFAEDYYLSVGIAAAGYGNVHVAEVLAAYRVWDNDANQRQRRKLVELQGLLTVFEEAIVPAYRARGWSLEPVERRRAALAARQADALGWSFFSAEEKDAIEAALLRLSAAPAVRRAIRAYRSGLGPVYGLPGRLLNTGRTVVKSLLRR